MIVLYFILRLATTAQSTVVSRMLIFAFKCRPCAFIFVDLTPCARGIPLKLCQSPGDKSGLRRIEVRGRHTLWRPTPAVPFLETCTVASSSRSEHRGEYQSSEFSVVCRNCIYLALVLRRTGGNHVCVAMAVGTCALGTRFLTRFAFRTRPAAGSDMRMYLPDVKEMEALEGRCHSIDEGCPGVRLPFRRFRSEVVTGSSIRAYPTHVSQLPIHSTSLSSNESAIVACDHLLEEVNCGCH